MAFHKKPYTQGRIIVLSGPSGAGKTTLHDLLLQCSSFKGKIIRSISATTRPPRRGERHGRDYLFFSKSMFEYKIRTGQFLEWARVFENYYGTPLKNVRESLRRRKHVLLCIDVQGGRQVKTKCPDAIMIFVRTSTFSELQRRLEKRDTDSPESIQQRLVTAQKELGEARNYDQVIINDTLNKAFDALRAYLEGVLASLPDGRRR